MIIINMNATPMTLLPGNGSLVQLWEARVPGFFIPKTIVICNTSMNSANVRELLKETFFQAGIEHSYSLVCCKYPYGIWV